MTVKRRIESLERKAPERESRHAEYALWAARINRARARAGLPLIGKMQMKAAPRVAETLSFADLLRDARLRAKG